MGKEGTARRINLMPPELKTRTCANCVHFHAVDEHAATGECRRNAPAATRPLFPPVNRNVWCGQFLLRDLPALWDLWSAWVRRTLKGRVMFTRQDYDTLHSLVFQPGYPGYRPTVREVPNGDGKVDREKRYAHVATKYLTKDHDAHRAFQLEDFLNAAHDLALDVARALGVPDDFMPRVTECALRVLEYPAGVGGHAHTDFDLFTLSLYRSHPGLLWLDDAPGNVPQSERATLKLRAGRALNPGLHIGELGELIGLGEATRHHVEPSTETQYSIVYFALPSRDAPLQAEEPGWPTRTAGQWLDERYARSRVAA